MKHHCTLRLYRSLALIIGFTLQLPAFAQDQSDDILLVSVGESYDRYSDVAVHLQGLLAGTTGYDGAQVDILENSSIESLADGYYDQNSADIALRSQIAQGYDTVILIPTIHTVPHSTIEYTLPVYDDAPIDNEYFAPEVFYEGCTQLSKLILSAGSTPLILLPRNSDESVNDVGEKMYRVANGVGLELIPAAYAMESAGVTAGGTEEAFITACSIFTQITGLNASVAGYSPSGVSLSAANNLADFAENTLNTHHTTEHYNTSYETDGAVVYRSLDVSSSPFNNVVRYRYKGSSTQDWTRDAIVALVGSNAGTSSAYRKLGTRNGLYSGGTRYWHADDLPGQASKISSEPDQAAFMYVTGSIAGSAQAQDLINLSQSNMIPLVFDWIKSFAISPAVSGTASTTDALDYHGCVDTYYNYVERGWKLVPLVAGMGRLNEEMSDFVASEDALHMSDLLVYMNAYMMLSASLGSEFPIPSDINDFNIHRGAHTVADLTLACEIGHDVIVEHAFLSETGVYVPDSDLSLVTDSLPGESVGIPYTNQLVATGGDGTYSWEVISSSDLPSGLSLSSDGVISGAAYEEGSFGVGFKVTDGTGAFRKVGLKLTIDANSDLPVADDDSIILLFNTTADILLTGTDSEGSTGNLTYSVADGPTNGILTGTAPDLTYSPNTDFVGADSFTFTVSDGVNFSVPATVSISVGAAQTDLEFADLSAALSGNTLLVGGSANNLVVSGAASGADYVYSVTYAGVDYDYDGLNDTLTFDVRVKAWTGGTIELGVDDPGSTSSASAMIGASPAAVNISNGARFTAGADTQMQEGESLEFVVENPLVALTDAGKVGSAVSSGFNAARLVETHNGHSHQTIFGSGTGLLGWDWNGPFDVSDISVGAGALYVSSDTSTGDNTRPFHWGVEDVAFGMTVSVEVPVIDDYEAWSAEYALEGAAALASADTENGGVGDGYPNLLEFALGMDPTVADARSRESIYTEEAGESSYFAYTYERRTDYLAQGLTYTLIMTPDLVTPSAESPFDVTVGDPVDGFQTITTRYLINDDAKFIQLQVDAE
ncbi:MAG: Ig-like domain-containing protein [Opitutaceae bacterium]